MGDTCHACESCRDTKDATDTRDFKLKKSDRMVSFSRITLI